MATQTNSQFLNLQDLWNNINNIHQGAWGTPDIGLSEFLKPVYASDTPQQTGGASGSWETTPTSPTGSPAPSGTNYVEGGWYGNKQYHNGQLYEGGYNPSQPTSGGSSGGTGGDSINYDAAYAPIFDVLNQAKDYYTNTEAPQAQAAIEAERARQVKALSANTDQAAADLAKNTNTINTQQTSALEEAQKAYSAMTQQAKSRFGMGSSAGQAVGELAQQEYFKNQGLVNQSWQQSYQGLLDRKAQVDKFVMDKANDIDDWMKEQVVGVQNKLHDTLLQIDMQKGQLESQKSQQKIAALQEVKNSVAALGSLKSQYDMQLDNWKQQQQYLIQNGLAQIYSQPVNITLAKPTTSTIGAGVNTNSTLTPRWNPSLGKYEYVDPLGNVVSTPGIS